MKRLHNATMELRKFIKSQQSLINPVHLNTGFQELIVKDACVFSSQKFGNTHVCNDKRELET
jgi:hypothetical protein